MSLGRRARVGFTLIEMLVTLAIIGLLATILLPSAQIAIQRSHEQELRRSLREMRQAIDAYKRAYDEGRIVRLATSNGYPRSLEVLVEGVADQRNPKRAKIFFLRRIPRDPFDPDTSTNAAQSWGKRSYASEANEPREGDDVYDVFSRSPRIGLNGAAYNQW